MRGTITAMALMVSASITLAATAAAGWTEPTVPNHAASPVELDDPTIVAIFDAANTADIETGQLAAERGHSKDVREFGAMLARDHDAVRQMGRDLAQRLGVRPTPPADDASAKAHAAAIAMLRSKRRADFDLAFLQHEFAFHKSVIEAMETTLLPAIENEELKELVIKVKPAFQAHMIAAKALERRLSGASR